MKMGLIKYKDIKLLIDIDAPLELFTANIEEITALDEAVKKLYANMLNATNEDTDRIEKMRDNLKHVSKGLGIIGHPFDQKDAELYAVDKGIEYDVLELHGNIGNKNPKKDNGYNGRLNIEIKDKWKFNKQADRYGVNMTKWINDTLFNALDDDLKRK